MKLLQYLNEEIEPEDMVYDYYFCEIKMQIECIAELCEEGEISVDEAVNIIENEMLCCMDYQDKLLKRLNDLDNDSDEYARNYTETDGSFLSDEEIEGLGELSKEWTEAFSKTALEKMDEYDGFLGKVRGRLDGIFKTADYYEKRKAKIKQQIIDEGLPSYLEKPDDTNEQDTNEQESKDDSTNVLGFRFPEFKNDLPLLIKHKFLEITDEGLRLGSETAKIFLSDYFKGIRPKKIKKMPWVIIESVFDLDDLRQSKNPNRKPSTDYRKWLGIKKAAAKQNTPLGKEIPH